MTLYLGREHYYSWRPLAIIGKIFSWEKLISKGSIQRKMLRQVQVCVSVTEKEACVFFPSLDGEADVTSVFFGKDPSFREWCLGFFNYEWERANEFDETKLKVDDTLKSE